MRNRIYLFVVLTCVFVIAFFIVYYSRIPYYKPAERMSGIRVRCHNDDTIRIAYVGDSWAFQHKIVETDMDSIITICTGKPVLIRNAGVGGLVSKDIYYGIFNNQDIKDVIEWGPNFCFVSAGINDTNKKMGSDYYRENMRLIVELLINNGITPVILEIPYYDIWYTFRKMNTLSMFRAVRSMIWTCSAMNCIDDYANALNQLLEEQLWQDKVIIIRRDTWNPAGSQGQKELYETDRMHINQMGYKILDSCIASEIVLFLKKTKDNFDCKQ